jgi:hypothetical protein
LLGYQHLLIELTGTFKNLFLSDNDISVFHFTKAAAGTLVSQRKVPNLQAPFIACD